MTGETEISAVYLLMGLEALARRIRDAGPSSLDNPEDAIYFAMGVLSVAGICSGLARCEDEPAISLDPTVGEQDWLR